MDDDFEELLCVNELLNGSSQESLTGAAANLSRFEADAEGSLYTFQDRDEYPCDRSQLSQRLAEHENDAPVPIKASAGDATKSDSNADVIDKIESVFEQIADALLNEKNEIRMALSTRRRVATDKPRGEDHPSRLSFPGRNANEAWRFAVVIRILELMHEALLSDVVISKRLLSSSSLLNDSHSHRDIYYRDPALFGSQNHVDRHIDDIAFTFGVTRTALNVTAVAKGLLAGSMTFCRRDGSTFSAAGDRDGMLVPALKDILCVEMSAVRWVLIIEKEASFRSVAASAFWDYISTEGVIITGKGYPDLSSRAMLRFLTTASPRNGFASPPVYGLADYDPDGVAILSTYKHGSEALAHEKDGHIVPKLRWLGFRSEDLLHEGNDSRHAQGIMTLTLRDRRKAGRMIEQGIETESGIDAEWSAELKRMLMLNVKAELQLLDGMPGGMSRLLEAMRSELYDCQDEKPLE